MLVVPGCGHRAARGSPDVVDGWRLVGWGVGVGQVLVEPDGDQSAGHLGERFDVDRAEQVPDDAVHLITDHVVSSPAYRGRSSRSTTRVRVRVSAGS